MPRIKSSESFPERSVSVLIVGTPFSYKTSLALTAKDVLLVDIEKGGERAHGRAKETFRIGNQGWQEYRDEVQNGMLDDFSTVVIDTGGAWVDDALWDYALKIKYTNNAQKNWGTVKEEFKKDYNKIRSSNKDLVVISHEKSVKNDDEVAYDLDMSGSGKQILLRGADMVGFISKKDFKVDNKIVTKTILTFNPTASTPFCKNVAQIPDMELPDRFSDDWDGFLEKRIIAPTKKRIAEMSEEQKAVLENIERMRGEIDALTGGNDELTAAFNAVKAIPEQHIQKQVVAYFSAHLKSIGWKWDKETSQFIDTKAAQPTDTNVGQSEPKTEPVDLFASEEK